MLRSMVLIGLLAAATGNAAVERSNDGYGQVLLYPYFSAGAELSTVASVSQTVSLLDVNAEEPLAISVVVKLDTGDTAGTLVSEHFTVFLAPHASWNFTLSQVQGRTALSTDSTTCAFRDESALTTGPVTFANVGAEGWIEVYLLGRTKTERGIGELLRLRQCAQIAERLDGLSAAEWLVPVGKALRGAAHLVDIPSGTSYSLPTVALKDFADTPQWGFSDQPTLADVSPPVAHVVASDGDWLDARFSANPVDAVSAVLMDARWEVDFTSEPALGARTDLVIVAPTREWYVGGTPTRAPFASHPSFSPNGSPRTIGRLHDRSGNVRTPPFQSASAQLKCTPPPTVVPQLGPAIGSSLVVVQFAPQPTLQSQRSYPMQHRSVGGGTCFTAPVPVWQSITSGRLALQFDIHPDLGVGSLTSDEGLVFTGLPVIGAALTKAVNGGVGGSLANFGLVQGISRTAGSP
ncbi:MAG: hypothetical protein ACT4NL_00540 [Pseudomarimonas sp.]